MYPIYPVGIIGPQEVIVFCYWLFLHDFVFFFFFGKKRAFYNLFMSTTVDVHDSDTKLGQVADHDLLSLEEPTPTLGYGQRAMDGLHVNMKCICCS